MADRRKSAGELRAELKRERGLTTVAQVEEVREQLERDQAQLARLERTDLSPADRRLVARVRRMQDEAAAKVEPALKRLSQRSSDA